MTRLIRTSPGRTERTLRTEAIMKRKGQFYGTARILGDRTSDRVAKLEQNPSDEPIRASKVAAFDSLVDIRFVQHRTRLTDSDNSSGKAVTDGLILAAIIKDDGPKEVRETRHSQIKVKNKIQEKTVIQITRVSE